MTAKRRLWVAMGGLVIAGLVSGCSDGAPTAKPVDPAKVEAVAGSKLKKVTLTQAAATRIAIATATVTDGSPSPRKVVPFNAIVYDPDGSTWVYVNLQPLVYLRHPVTVDRIIGHDAILTEGPVAGTAVVIVGVAELYGAETGVGK